MKKLLTFLTLLTLFFTTAGAETYSFTPSKVADISFTGASATKTLNGVDWTIAQTSKNTDAYWGYSQNYIQFGSKTNTPKTLTLSTSGISGTITSVKVNTYKTSNASATLTVSVGGTSYTNGDNTSYTLTTTGSTVEFTGSTSGEIVIFFKQTATTTNSSTAIYFGTIEITYDDGGVNTYNITGTGNFDGGSVTASATSGITEGTNVTLTVAPEDDYELGTLTVDGVDVTSSVDNNNQYTFTMPSHDVVVSATFNFTGAGVKYSLVTKTGDILNGEDYIIVNNSKDAIAGPIGSNKYFSSIDYGFNVGNDNTITTTGSANEVFTLEADEANPGFYYLKGKSLYYYIQGDKVYSVSNKADAKSVNIYYNENGFVYIGVAENQSISSNNRKLGYNYNSPRFAPYASLSTNQSGTSTIYLYKKGDPSPEPEVGEPTIAFGEFTDGETTLDVTIAPGENATKTYYKVGDGNYAETDGTETIDLTQVESPITVYAKSSDNENNESAEAHMNFTVPALEVSISPASYSGYDAQEVTLTASNNVGNAAISYKIGDGEVQTYSAPFSVSEVGTHNITAYATDQRASAVQAEATATITIAEQPSGETVVATFVAGTDQGGNGAVGNPDEMSKGDGQAQVTVSSTNAAFATSEYRLYQNSVTTISVPEGSTITKIEFIGCDNSKPVSNLSLATGSTGSYSVASTSNKGTWIGEASSISFDASAQARCSGINVTYIVGSAPADLYIIGNVNGIDVDHWHANQGVKMTRKNGVYTADIWVTGKWNDQMQKYAGTFAFFTVLAENNDDGSWSYVNGNRYEPDVRNINNPDEQVGSSHWWLANDENSVNTNVTLLKRNWDDDFMIPAGLYTVTVSEDLTKFNLTVIKDLTPSITPDEGEVAAGTKATIALSENFNEFIANCPKVLECTHRDNGSVYTPLNLTLPEVKLYVNNEVAEGISGEYTFSAEQSPVTVTGKGALVLSGTEYASKTASKDYTVVKKYTATIATGITGGAVSFNADTQQNTLNNLTAGYTVNVFVTENTDWELATLTYTAEGSSEAVNITATATAGQYSFAMPASNVTINATFNYIGTATLTTYRRITSTNEIEVGKKYLIVNEANNRVQLSGTENSTTIAINNHETTVSSESGIGEFVLGSDNNGYYSFYSGGKYLANSGSSTYDIVTALSDNCYWSISFTEPDADDNVYATIKAKNYNRIVYYFGSTGGYFRTYSSNNYSSNVQLYKEVSAPTEMTLREIILANKPGTLYKISNEEGLLGVYSQGTSVWFKDEEQAVDYQNPTAANYEYYTVVETNMHINKSEKDFAQNNWIEVVFPSEKDFSNKYVRNLTGTYSCENGNPKLTLTVAVDEENDVTGVPSSGSAYELNPYMAVNFTGNQTYTNSQGVTSTFFFSKPKAQEYAQILWAVWDGTKFNMPSSTDDNYYGFTGSFTISPELNAYSLDGLQNTENINKTYNFHAIIRKEASGSKAAGDVYKVYPTDLRADVPTAIGVVNVNGIVKSVKYVNVAGMVSDVPFQGVNIVVTEYSDGSRSTSKMLRK